VRINDVSSRFVAKKSGQSQSDTLNVLMERIRSNVVFERKLTEMTLHAKQSNRCLDDSPGFRPSRLSTRKEALVGQPVRIQLGGLDFSSG
jgi:hypothetical protein